LGSVVTLGCVGELMASAALSGCDECVGNCGDGEKVGRRRTSSGAESNVKDMLDAERDLLFDERGRRLSCGIRRATKSRNGGDVQFVWIHGNLRTQYVRVYGYISRANPRKITTSG